MNQGKALGGSSAINAQVFVPPTGANTDAWETLGNKDWNSALLQEYITRAYTSPSVDRELAKALDIDGWAGINDRAKGPIHTSFARVGLQEPWATTLNTISHSVATDPFLAASSGSFSQLNSIDPVAKERSYSASKYYHPVKDRKNLVVLTGARAEKIILGGESPGTVTATGVEYTQDGKKYSVTATKEVILSAGALQSPKLLELSGIGNAEILAKHDIEALVDLPGVGENLQDHLVCAISYHANDSVDTMDPLLRQEPEALAQAVEEYTTNKSGLLTGSGIDCYAYLPITDDSSDPGFERLAKTLRENQPSGSEPYSEAYAILSKTLLDREAATAGYLLQRVQAVIPVDTSYCAESPTGPLPGKFLTIAALLSHPVSRGSVHIRSADPAAPPAIDPAYLSHPADVEVFAQHMLQIERIAAAGAGLPFQRPLRRWDPASDLAGDLDRAKRMVRAGGVSMWHPAGACAMLPLAQQGVVDDRLRVHKVGGLRVVDASVMPLIPTANPQATVYGIAERAADLIKTAWNAM